MDDLFRTLFATGPFIPHGHCYLWKPGLVWLHLISDGLTALAYYSIPLTLFYFVRRRKDLPFHGIFLLFAAFIIACGTTHVMEIWTLWHPTYWLSGLIKATTAMVSVFTAMELFPLVPQALALPSPTQLEQVNQNLQTQIQERLRVEEALRQSQSQLEHRIQERTAELVAANQHLQQEVQDRQRAEAEIAALNRDLQHRVNELQTLFEVIPIGILLTEDPEFQRVRANPAFAQILGIPAGGNASETPPDGETHPGYQIFSNGKRLSIVENPLRYAALHGVTVERAEVDILRQDGTWFNLYGYASPLFDEHGQVRGAVGAFLDITARKQAEQALTQSEERFRALIEQAADAILIADIQGNYTEVNTSACRLLGYTREELVSKRIVDLIPPEDVPRLHQSRQLLLAGEPQVEEWTLIRKDGVPILVEVSTKILADQRWQAFVRDIRDRKQYEAERDQLLAQLESSLKTLEAVVEAEQQARAEAEAANRVKDEFLAVLSHELRTPLNPILGWVRLLQTAPLDDQKRSLALQTIERNAKLQTQLIEDLLDISRILRGKLSLNTGPVDLAMTLEAAKETVRIAAEAKAIQIVTEVDTTLGAMYGDANRLQQVFWNLLSNAVKFTPTEGQITVRLVGNQAPPGEADAWAAPAFGAALRPGQRYVQVTVTDTGKGISAEFLPYVFEYFRQADSSTTRSFGGLGLGLAIARQIVEMHGGAIQASSPGDGQGATFTVWLPYRPAGPESEAAPPDRALASLNGIRVLVVEDDPDSRDFIRFVLEQQSVQVMAVSSAADALRVMDQAVLDVLVSDIGMPDVNGYSLMRQIRSRHLSRGGTIKAIALTAYASEADRQEAIAAGFHRHLPKPVQPEALIQAILDLVQ